jgi:Holliday junction resolvase
MQPETRLVNKIRRALENIGAKTVKTHGSAYGSNTPDILGCIEGRSFAIEVKQEGQYATPAQVKDLIEWAKAGAMVGVAHNVCEALLIIGKVQSCNQ